MNYNSIQADYSLQCEVYGPDLMSQTFANSVKVEMKRQLGSGGQAQVFECKFWSETGAIVCVDKFQKVFNNPVICCDKFKEMYKEFRIGFALDHPGIVKYLFFFRQQSMKHGAKEQEFHILIELCEGGNLDQFLSK